MNPFRKQPRGFTRQALRRAAAARAEKKRRRRMRRAMERSQIGRRGVSRGAIVSRLDDTLRRLEDRERILGETQTEKMKAQEEATVALREASAEIRTLRHQRLAFQISTAVATAAAILCALVR